MSEHKIAQDNIDIDVDVSSNVADDKALNTSSDDTLENVSASETIQDSAEDIEAENVKAKDGEESYLPLLALRDVVVYPHMQIALFVGRAPSVKAVELAQAEYGNKVLVVAQKDSLTEDIDQDNLYQYGTVCRIVSTMPHDSDENCIKVLIEGQYRARVDNIENHDELLMASFTRADLDISMSESQQKNTIQALTTLFEGYADARLRNARELTRVAKRIDDLLELVYFISTRVSMDLDIKQSFLEEDDIKTHINTLTEYLVKQSAEQNIEQDIQDAVRQQMEDNQREYFLNEKMKAIKNELSDMNDGAFDEDDVAELEQRLEDADLPEDVRKKAEQELKKLKMMPPASSESSVVRNYIEWILDTPWNATTKVSINLDKAKTVLDEDHYGLQDVKDRILEYLAVQSRVKKLRGPILCLVGPPGVGKTSLGESIARATGRKFVRMALGGVRDEAEIRGHRRTYIGAMPGKIVQSLAKVEVKNPLFLLDEIDKMAQDFRGDPASALLEVLDPSQNDTFNDHYLDMDLDLSQVMFICTANSMDIPPALLDRMEVIRLPGYTEEEKVNIAQKYLVPKAIKNNGLKEGEIEIVEAALHSIVRSYTREAGVRNLEREVNKICRKVVRGSVETHGARAPKKAERELVVVDDKNIDDYLGVHQYDYGLAEEEPEIGRVTGLAWTQVGGELLTIEAVAMKGKGELSFTGSLGDVMKESIRAAMSVVRARGDSLGIDYETFKTTDVHVHMPEGATPKDGPSAGGALTTALVSALTGIAIRPDIAMTGEITLRGKILRIGGLKEKLLAAHRGGIKHVLIPATNERDLADIPDNVKEGLTIQPVATIDEILKVALVSMPVPLKPAKVTVDKTSGKALHN
ncbi:MULTISPECIES: endopeptidase La [Psychrobacter]|uniref:endopeptidase La n=1 Tax=Psychrobacter TaxID=497 RepID=UPI000EC588AF|nr:MULTISPECIES: endopeptidase La [Psychrobacter]MBK3394098.1 endopeptidase La [Psychrobacter sp. M9-54-1]HCR87764.1 endopeptidase La [Psychrobacter sp.]